MYDQKGKRYLDGLSGLFVSQIGHGRREVAEAGARQATELAYFPLWSYAHPRAVELAERLAALAPGDLNRVFFTTSGSEAVESAWKLAKQYFKTIGEPARYKVLSRDIAYHGTSMGALAITGLPVDQGAVRAAAPGRGPDAEHQLLPRARLRRRRPDRVRPVGRGRDRAGHPARGPGVGGRGLPGAGAELGRLLPAAARLLRPGPGDLRPVRRAAGLRRGHLRVRPARPLLRLAALRLPAGHHHVRQGSDLRVRPARRHDGQRPADGAVQRGHAPRSCTA